MKIHSFDICYWFFNSIISSILQTTEYTAKVLMNAGYACELRGPTYIKGKGTMTTYFVKTPFDERI
jgi:hypothetical protein